MSPLSLLDFVQFATRLFSFTFDLVNFIVANFHLQVFIIIHVVALVYYIKGILSPKMFKVAVTFVISTGL